MADSRDGDPAERAQRLLSEGHRRRDGGDWSGAVACFREARAFYAEHGTLEAIAHCDRDLGGALHQWGEYVAAAGHHRAALAHYRLYGPPYISANCELDLSLTLYQLREYAAAAKHLRATLAYFRDRGPESYRAACEYYLGITLLAIGRYETAAEHLRAALAYYRIHGTPARLPARLADCQYNLGVTLYHRGRLTEALPCFEAAARVWAEIDRENEAAVAVEVAAEACRQLGDMAGQVTYQMLQIELQARWRRRQGLAPPPLTAGQQTRARATAWELVASK